MTEHAVVIVGGGPTGMMLGAELALAKVDVAIVERRAGQDLAASRSGGLLSRTIEVLDQRGVAVGSLRRGRSFRCGGSSPVRHRTTLKNRIHATLIRFGHPCPVSDLFGHAGRELLDRLQIPDPWRRNVDDMRAIASCLRCPA